MMALSSDSVEEYLEAIYSFNERGERAKNTDIAKRLKVAPPSVTQMLKKLADRGYVIYVPYRGTVLTGRGMALAQRVVRKHRLLERFFYDYLGMAKGKVHDEACRMEHSLSDETTMALCKALDNPEVCPDDLPIPHCIHETDDCEECANISAKLEREHPLTTQLSNLKPGEEGHVAFIRGGRRSSKRIQDMGLTPGAFIKMLNAAPFKGPVEVEVRGTSVALGRTLASQVYIQVEDEGKPWKRAQPHGPHHGNIRNN